MASITEVQTIVLELEDYLYNLPASGWLSASGFFATSGWVTKDELTALTDTITYQLTWASKKLQYIETSLDASDARLNAIEVGIDSLA